jgi:tRNA (guanine26-N2/guanine27-N2)-dimethyltransferase
MEVPEVDSVILGDLNPNAITLAKENAVLNGLNDVVEVCLIDANLLLSLHDRPLRRFHYIDVDPYGSPSPFMDSAVRASRNHGMIGLTATDMAPLCGVNPEACLRKYGGLPLRSEYCHEVALRLVVGAVVETAARHKVAARPVFSYAADHYVRLYVSLEHGAKRADRSLDQVGYLLHCFVCLHRRSASLGELGESSVCSVCGSKMEVGGPMWLGDLADEAFCRGMLSFSERSEISSNLRLMKLIELVEDEVGFSPGFVNIDKLCSRLGLASISTNEILFALRKKGFKAVKTHIDDRGIKTDASITDLENVIKGILGRAVGG